MTEIRVIPPNAIWVFDFDQTITHRHTGGIIFSGLYAAQKAMATSDMLHNIKPYFWETLVAIAQLNGQIVIASYADTLQHWRHWLNPFAISGQKLIEWAIKLSAVGAPRAEKQLVFPRLHIIAKHSRDQKKYHLKKICDLYNVSQSDASRIVYFDNERRYVKTFKDFGATLVADTATVTAEISTDGDLFSKLHSLLTFQKNEFPRNLILT